MTPTAIAYPLVTPALPSGSAQRPLPPELRPVEPTARVRPWLGGLEPGRDAAPEPRADSYRDRRRSLPAGFRPARPQPGAFLAQALVQQAAPGTASETADWNPGEAAARGSEAYRRAGAEPALFSQEPAFYRILA